MSPIFSGAQTTTSASQQPLPKGLYTFKVTDVAIHDKSYPDQLDENGDPVRKSGVRYTLEYESGASSPEALKQIEKGYRTSLWLYFHTEGGRSAAKRFVMACLGFKPGAASEAQFNKYVADNFSEGADIIDTDSNEIGAYWRAPIGTSVVGDLDISLQKETNAPQQSFKRWMPYAK